MPETQTENSGRRRGRKAESNQAFEQALAAAREALAEAWERFVGAIDDTQGQLAASIGVTLSYKPPGGDKPAKLEVAGKASLPTQRHVFRADLEHGQLALGLVSFDA